MTDTPRVLLGVREAAAALGVGRSTLYGMMKRGQLASLTIGTRRLVPLGAVDELVARRLGGTDSNAAEGWTPAAASTGGHLRHANQRPSV